MKNVIALSVVLIMLSSSFVFADFNDDVTVLQSEVVGKVIPGPIGFLFGDERMNLHVEMATGEVVTVGVVTDNKVVEEFAAGAIQKPSINIYTDQETMASVQGSDDPLMALRSALDGGEITYSAVGLFNKMKFGFWGMFFGMSKESDKSDVEIVEKEETEDVVDVAEEDDVVEEVDLEEEAEEAEEEQEEIKLDGPTTHTVSQINTGFSVGEVVIAAGDAVEWVNERSGAITKGMIIGAQKCTGIKSTIYNPGESFTWIFDEPMTCVIVDGIMTKQTMKVIVE